MYVKSNKVLEPVMFIKARSTVFENEIWWKSGKMASFLPKILFQNHAYENLIYVLIDFERISLDIIFLLQNRSRG